MKLVTVSEMQKIEKEADAGGLTYDLMMENAGQGLADIVLDLFVDDVEPEALGLVGPGNNGGDTLVALTALVEAGWKARAYLVKRKKDDHLKRFLEAGGEVLSGDRLLNNSQNQSKLPMYFWMASWALASNCR